MYSIFQTAIEKRKKDKQEGAREVLRNADLTANELHEEIRKKAHDAGLTPKETEEVFEDVKKEWQEYGLKVYYKEAKKIDRRLEVSRK
jgi:hypothetical protein